ncbi:MAG: MarR family transcriptional regulator, partial [Lentisphaeria bacterium]|nr:MarR family transcriptional regulator [Lentisphaeria bacterium]
ITRDQIKNIAHVHASNVTRAIDYMEEKGYITKVLKEDDKRICLLFPTEKLKEVYDVLIEAEKEWTSIITVKIFGSSQLKQKIFTLTLNILTEIF